MSAVWVVKLGSSLLTANGEALDRRWIAQVAAQVAALRTQGVAVVLVSSGAVAAGLARLGRAERPTELAQLQAVAAIGQPDVMQAWSVALAEHGLVAAQLRRGVAQRFAVLFHSSQHHALVAAEDVISILQH